VPPSSSHAAVASALPVGLLVLGGTVALDAAKYLSGGRLLFADMGSHGMEDGDLLNHALFPKIYPCSDPAERAEAAAGGCTRTFEGVSRMWGGLFKSLGEMGSFANVVNIGPSKEGGGKGKSATIKLPSPPFPHDAPEIPLPSFLLPKDLDASSK